jgi:hypothetical protein
VASARRNKFGRPLTANYRTPPNLTGQHRKAAYLGNASTVNFKVTSMTMDAEIFGSIRGIPRCGGRQMNWKHYVGLPLSIAGLMPR